MELSSNVCSREGDLYDACIDKTCISLRFLGLLQLWENPNVPDPESCKPLITVYSMRHLSYSRT